MFKNIKRYTNKLEKNGKNWVRLHLHAFICQIRQNSVSPKIKTSSTTVEILAPSQYCSFVGMLYILEGGKPSPVPSKPVLKETVLEDGMLLDDADDTSEKEGGPTPVFGKKQP